MNPSVTRQDLERFRSAIVEQVGLHFDDSKLSFLEEVLRRRIGRLACSSADYLAKLAHEKPHAESLALAEELAVAETYFFRHNDQFRALAGFDFTVADDLTAEGDARLFRPTLPAAPEVPFPNSTDAKPSIPNRNPTAAACNGAAEPPLPRHVAHRGAAAGKACA